MNKCQVKITADVPINVILNTGAKFKDIQKEKLQAIFKYLLFFKFNKKI